MRRRGIFWALTALLACGATAAAQAAVVRSDLTGHSGKIDGGARVELTDDHGHRHHHGHGHGDRDRDWGRRDWDRGGWGRGHSDFSLFFDFASPRYYATAPSCQPIVQNGYWYGRPAQIGSTLCYDAWGNSYIVDGSAYVIQFLDGYPW